MVVYKELNINKEFGCLKRHARKVGWLEKGPLRNESKLNVKTTFRVESQYGAIHEATNPVQKHRQRKISAQVYAQK